MVRGYSCNTIWKKLKKISGALIIGAYLITLSTVESHAADGSSFVYEV